MKLVVLLRFINDLYHINGNFITLFVYDKPYIEPVLIDYSIRLTKRGNR